MLEWVFWALEMWNSNPRPAWGGLFMWRVWVFEATLLPKTPRQLQGVSVVQLGFLVWAFFQTPAKGAGPFSDPLVPSNTCQRRGRSTKQVA